MTKQEFIDELRDALSDITDHDREERVAFYGEMIDDFIDEGISEEAAVEKVGPIDRIVNEVLGDTPLFELLKRKVKPKRRLEGWEIALIAITSPIWLSMAISAVSVIISLFVTMWSVIVSLWAVLLACGASAAAGVLGGILVSFTKTPLLGVMLIGAGITLAGLSILVFYLCNLATKGAAVLSKSVFLGIKKLFL